MRKVWPFLAFLAASPAAFGAPAALPAPVIDNDRVTVWDVTLNKGAYGPFIPGDSVVMYLDDESISTALAPDSFIGLGCKFGDARITPKDSHQTDTLTSDGPAHELIVQLKDHPEPPVANPTSYPLAFPRPGAVKMLENDRVIVWRYSWTPGTPTAMHFHDKDVVVAYRYDGTLKSVMPDGSVMENPYKRGEIRFNKANRSHSELLATARQSAVILELK